MGSKISFDPDGDLNVPETTYAHPSLETLILDREGILFSLRRVSFPSLRLLAVHGRQFIESEDRNLLCNIFTKILSRSSTEPLLISLQGEFQCDVLVALFNSLPHNSHLLFDIFAIWSRSHLRRYEGRGCWVRGATIPIESDNIDSIICGQDPVDLSWLSSINKRSERHSSRPSTIYLPTEFQGWEQGYSRRDELRSRGFELKPLTKESAQSMLISLAPHLSKHTEGWWEYKM